MIYVGTLPPHPGGSAVSCSQLLVGFARMGHAVRALAPMTKEAQQSGDEFAASHPDIGVTRFLMPYFESAPNIAPADDYRKLEADRIKEILPAQIAEHRPDIIIIGRETFAWQVPDLARAHSLPCVSLIRGSLMLGILSGSYPEIPARQFLEQFRKVDLIVTPAKHLTEAIQGLGFSNVKTILNAIDLTLFFPAPKDDILRRKLVIPDGSIIVMHVSNLKSQKRPLDVVYSAEVTLRKNPNLMYVIVGDGACRNAMEETCRQKGIAEHFRFVGWVDYDEIPKYINLADIVIMPSEAEALARVYLETQASGRLLLASDIPASREVIKDGETGLLFQKADVNDLAAKTLLAAGEAPLRAEIGRKASKRALAHSLDEAVASYLATFEDIIQKHQG